MSLVMMFLVLVILVVLSVPLVFAIGASGIVYLLIENPSYLLMLPQRLWGGTNSFVLIALPLFILAGELMNSGGLTKRLINFCLFLLRPIRGGLGEVNVVASMLFGGISGSSVADTAALGSVLIPSMIKKGYSREFSAGVTVASSTIGMIIPPSIPMLIYSMISGASVGALFMAGAIPGIMVGLSQLIIVYVISKRQGYHHSIQKYELSDIKEIVLKGVLAALMPLFIIFSISFGIATATEAAALAVLYALIVGAFVYRELTWKHIKQSLKKTVMVSSSIMIIIAFTMLYTWILAVEQVPSAIVQFIMDINLSHSGFMLVLVVLVLVFGTFMDVAPMLLLLCPIFIPVVKIFGIGELQFGVIMIVGAAIGLATPPIGMCLNVATKICGIPITKIFRSTIPWILCNLIVLLLVSYIPELSTWLPTLIK